MTKTSTAMVKYEQELAKMAEEAAAMEAGVGGSAFFSLRGGTLSLGGAPLPNDEMACVLIDSVLENAYYVDAFDAENQSSPACYAFGRDQDEMAPEDTVEDKQNDTCAGCPMNEFGSADRGRGKKCGNRRRIACIPAGTLDKSGSFEAFNDPDAFAKAPVAYLRLPPTSLKSYAQYVKQIAGALKRPPSMVFTKVSLIESEKVMFMVCFELLDPVPNELIPVLLERHKAEMELITFPYQKIEREAKGGKDRRPEKRARKY